MKRRNFHLDPETERILKRIVERERFPSEAAAVRTGIHLLDLLNGEKVNEVVISLPRSVYRVRIKREGHGK